MSATILRMQHTARDAAITLLRTDDRGLLHLLHASFDPMRRNWSWTGLATSGHRNLLRQHGTFVLQDDEAPEARLVECATGPRSDPKPVTRGGITPWVLAGTSAPPGTGSDPLDRLAAVCGRATFALAHLGVLEGGMHALDELFGAEAVERIVARFPVLVGLLLRVGGGQDEFRDEQSRADLSALVDPGTDPETFANAAWRLSRKAAADAIADRDIGRPHSPWRGPLPDLDPVPGQARRFLRRLEGVPTEPEAGLIAFRLAPLAHRDWLPSRGDEAEAMACVLEAALRVSIASGGTLAPHGLLAPVGGNWARTAAQLSRHCADIADDPAGLAGQALDMAEAFLGQVLRPAAAYATAATGRPEAPLPGIAESWRLLFEGKGIAALAEANADWHVRGAAMTDTISGLAGMASGRWPRAFPDFTASNGRTIVPILTSASLVAEGSAMGHCVGSYGRGCANGSYAVASVRTADGARSSTVQIAKGLSRVMEHKGPRNSAPAPEDRQAVQELLADAATRRLSRPPLAARLRARIEAMSADIREAASPRWLRQGGFPYNPADPARVARAASLWDRYLPRTARGSIPALLSSPAPTVSADLSGLGRLPRIGSPAELARSFASGGFGIRWVRRHLPLDLMLGILVVLSLVLGFLSLPDLPRPGPDASAGAAAEDASLETLRQVRMGIERLAEMETGVRPAPPAAREELARSITRLNGALPPGLRIPDTRLAIAERAEAIRKARTSGAPLP